MEMDFSEYDFYLRQIFTGMYVFTIDDKDLLFRHPSNEIKLKASSLYKKVYTQACSEGLLPRKDLEQLIDSRNILTDDDKYKLGRLEAKLEGQLILLGRTVKVKANQDRLKKIIKDLQDEIASIKNKRTSKLFLSAEVKAEEARYDYYCRLCTYINDGKELYWKTLYDFKNDTDLDLRQQVLNTFTRFMNGITTDVIRYIARSNMWRIRYITSGKTSETLFGIPTSDYTDDMLNLVFWSNYYQNIYEMLPDDRPPENIIEDDEALDAYMNSYYEERSKDSKVNRYNKGRKGKLSAFDSEEVIVTRSNELYEDMIYDTPREAQKVKDRSTLKKRTRRS